MTMTTTFRTSLPSLRRRVALLALSVSFAVAATGCAAETDADDEMNEDSAESEDGLGFGNAKPLGPDPKGEHARYPIVFVHGFTGSRNVWNFVGVPEALEKDGHKVYAAQLPPFGTPDENAKVLNQQVDEVLQKTGARKVNIIAHSKGGLDARAFVSNYNHKPGVDKVASLTTIATPNHGTNIADAALKLIPASGHAKVDGALAAATGIWTRLLSDGALSQGNDVREALVEMSEANADSFSRRHPSDSRVHYQSWAGVSNILGIKNSHDEDGCEGKGYMHGTKRDVMHPALAAVALFTGHSAQFTSSKYTPNDGMSTVASAKLGEFKGCLPADHMDDVGFKLIGHRKPGPVSQSGFDQVRFYRQVAYDLARHGF